MRELKSVQGGYYWGTASDAAGSEGDGILFTPEEVTHLLGEEAGKHFADCYDISAETNFNGKCIPNLLLNNRWNMLPEGYAEYRKTLLTYRRQRTPAIILSARTVEANALMLSALAQACRAFGNYRYLQEALHQAAFVEELYADGRLNAEPGSDRCAGLRGYTSYALALLDLYTVDFAPEHLLRAEELAKALLFRFADAHGGYYDAVEPCDAPLIRPKEVYDDELPSGNGLAAQLFGRLARLTGKKLWKDAFTAQMSFLAAASGPFPAGCTSALCEQVIHSGGRTVVCVSDEEAVPEQLDVLTAKYAPGTEVLLKTPSNADALSAAVPFTSEMHTVEGKTTFYILAGERLTGPLTM